MSAWTSVTDRTKAHHITEPREGVAVTPTFSEGLKELLDRKVFVIIATVQPDGSPQLSPVWVQRDGDELLISTTVGRRKERNLRRDSRITVLVQPADAPYSYAEIRGVAHVTTEGGPELIDKLALKYAGKTYAEFNADADKDDPRVVVRVTPRKIVGQGI